MAVTLNAKYLEPFVKQGELEAIFPQVQAAHHTIHERSGPGNDFLGWLDLPVDYDREEFARIQKAAQKIRSHSQILIVIGIGGSYLGARAAIELLHSQLYNDLVQDAPKIYFVGNSISPSYLNQILKLCEDKDFSSTLFPNPVPPPNRRWRSASSVPLPSKNMAERAQRTESSVRPTRQKEPSSSWQTRKAMKPL